jgi:hypothetical protein
MDCVRKVIPVACQCGTLTRIGNLDLDHASLERLVVQSQGLLQPLHVGKLNIAKTLGALHLAVLDDSDAGNIAALKELGDGLHGRIVGEIAEVGGVGRSTGDLLRGGLANGVAWEGIRYGSTSSQNSSITYRDPAS